MLSRRYSIRPFPLNRLRLNQEQRSAFRRGREIELERRKLNRNWGIAIDELTAFIRQTPYEQRDHAAEAEFERRCNHHMQKLEMFESSLLTIEARRLGIEIPENSQWGRNRNAESNGHYWLSDFGRTGVTKLIKEERRKNIEWWIKLITPILSALISLLGLIVALVTVSKK